MTRALLLAALLSGAAFGADAGAKVQKPTVAVLYFEYDKEDDFAAMRKGLAAMLISDLSANDGFDLVERSRLQAVFDELKLSESKKLDPATAAKAGKLLGAHYVVLGNIAPFMGQVSINTHVLEIETGRTLRNSVRVAGKNEQLFDLAAQLSQRLGAQLNEQLPLAEAGKKEARAPLKRPAKGDAKLMVQYSQALDALDKKDKAGAKKQLQQLVKEQPDFVLASLDLEALMK
jgi:TolB-like protein